MAYAGRHDGLGVERGMEGRPLVADEDHELRHEQARRQHDG